jgi:hypothetical protein
MSPESKPTLRTSGSQSAERGSLRAACDASPACRATSEKVTGHLPKGRATAGLSLLGFVCSWVAVASAAAFVACGLWQVGAIIGHAREVAHEVFVARAAAPANLDNPRRRVVASGATSAAFERGSSPNVPRLGPEQGIATSAGPVITAATNTSDTRAAAAVFEALAEASENVVPLGLAAALDDSSTTLTLGYPPPPEYPRAGCEEIYVYIVSVAEGAPRWSAASIGVGKEGPARLRRPGESIGDWTVLAISDDWTGLNPDVWLEKDGRACRAELEGNPSRIHQAPKPRPRLEKRRRRRRR